MIHKTKKGIVILLVLGVVLLSGLSGFAGAYAANSLKLEAGVKGQSGAVSLDSIQLTSTDKASGEVLSISEIAELAADSVVEISTETVTRSSRMRQYISEGAGSGVVISKDGYIVTNNHVIDGASKITVMTHDQKSYTATLVGKDSKTDLAVLKISATNLQPAVYGDSSKLVVGELAVAIGNPLGQLGGTVTEGIISALNRDINIDGSTMNLLQTSAALNPGNSGGGLFNEYGELVGIVNAKSSGSGIEGIGFAIPINTVTGIVDDILAFGYVQGRIDTGLTLLDISDTQTALMYRVQSKGLYVLQVNDSASKFKSGDRILSVDGTTISNASQFNQMIDKHKVGDTLNVVVSRNKSDLQLELTLKQAKE